VLWITRVGLDLAEGTTLLTCTNMACTTFIQNKASSSQITIVFGNSTEIRRELAFPKT